MRRLAKLYRCPFCRAKVILGMRELVKCRNCGQWFHPEQAKVDR